jgi:outer membrane receptor protein involved in Fe transport
MHLKTEIYYQWLFDVPVLPSRPEESFINYAQDDEFDPGDMIFVNKGKGRNYGVEITLEKFFDKHYYFLLTASLYDSKYTPIDGIERHTRFAGNYAFNALFGYEWKTGKRSLLSVNTKLAYIGGKREVPMNLVEVQPDEYQWRFDYTQAYKKQLPAYFRLDLNVNMKTNYKHYSLEWFIEMVNLTNHDNVRARYYNSISNTYDYALHYKFLPIFGCKVYF